MGVENQQDDVKKTLPNDVVFKPVEEEEEEPALPFHDELFVSTVGDNGNGAGGQGDNQDGDNADMAPEDKDTKNGGAPAADQPAAKDAPAKDKVEVNDKAEGAAPEQKEPVNPFDQIDKAQAMSKEIERLRQEDRKPDEKITVRVNGEIKEVTVAERVAQLKQSIKETIDLAKQGADAVRQKGDARNKGVREYAKENDKVLGPLAKDVVDSFLRNNEAARNQLARELKIDPDKLDLDKLSPEVFTLNRLGRWYEMAEGDPVKQKKISDFSEAQADRDALSRLHYAPTLTRLVEAELRARGHLDPTLKFGEETPESEIKKAFELVSKLSKPGNEDDVAVFGGGKEIREAKEIFETSEKTVNVLYMNQQQKRAEAIIGEIAQASKEDAVNPEEHFKQAIKLAETLNVGYLANQAYRPDNIASGITQELIDIVRVGSTARLKYAEYLTSKSRFHEAQGLIAQVKADSPELIFTQDEKTKKLDYREINKKTYEEVDRSVTLGITINPASFEHAQSLLFDKVGNDKVGDQNSGKQFIKDMQDGKFATNKEAFDYLGDKDGKATAWECLKMMKLCREQFKKDITEANEVLDKELVSLAAKKKIFDDKKDLSDDDKVEKARLERQIFAHEQTKQQREKYINRIDALTDFAEGIMHLSNKSSIPLISGSGAESAHEFFKKALDKDPDLNAEFEKVKAAQKAAKPDDDTMMTIAEFKDLTEDSFKAYWKRNYKKFAVAGAAAIGTLTGVGLIGVCGSLGAGITTTAVVATVGGAATGGATHWAVHRSVNPKAGWAEFRDGAKIGGLSAALVCSPWAAQAYRAKMAGDVAVTTSTIGNIASKVGVTRGTLAGSLALSYTFEAGNVLIDGKPIGRAAVDGTKEGVFNSLLLGISRNWGLSSEGAVKQAMINRYTIGTGFGLAATPQIAAVAIDGKPFGQAAKETVADGLQYTVMLGVMNKFGVQEPGKATGLSRFGLNKWTVGGGFALSAVPAAKDFFFHNKPIDQAGADFLTNGLLNTGAFAALKVFGLNDYGRGPKPVKPTLGDTASYGWRAFAMQESWNVVIARGMKQYQRDIMRGQYSIADQGPGFVAPLADDFFKRYFGPGLDYNHPGDRKTINQTITPLIPALENTINVNRQHVDPLKMPPKKGLFTDYSKPPQKKP
ncbi:MAG: hypothetical protein K2X93_28470 [Candidatus Obscuribacterales bacterium]|nr:hypothetical protein [Candidatus Obscuribacterales bacterium]